MSKSVTKQVKLPQQVAAAVSKDVFSYGGAFSDLSESQLLKLSDVLAPYYPPSEDETAAALALREWLTARQVTDDATQSVKRLEDLAAAGVREWSNVVDRWYHEREYRHERRYREERHPEMHHEMLHKELHYKLKSGDPQALIMAVERIVEETLGRNAPFAFGASPQVQVSDEIAKLAKEVAKDTRSELATYVDRVAQAKQVLARYVHQIVAREEITPEKE